MAATGVVVNSATISSFRRAIPSCIRRYRGRYATRVNAEAPRNANNGSFFRISHEKRLLNGDAAAISTLNDYQTLKEILRESCQIPAAQKYS